MKPNLIDHICCPTTKEPLVLRDAVTVGSGEIVSGNLQSRSGATYPIKDGVPILLPLTKIDAGQKETASSFSEKWKRAPGYRENTKPHYIAWYLERYGFRTIDKLRTFLSNKKYILDAGTGEGRDSEMYALNSSAQVFGVDISEGINIAYAGLGRIPNLHLIRADLTQLPFRENFFDFIACDQVIHHTRDTHDSLRCLLRHLSAGHIAIYTYKKKAPVREFCDDLIREKAVKMTPDECMALSESITKLGKSLSDLNVEITVPEDIPILGLTAGRHNLQRWIYWNFFKCYWNDSMDWNSNVVTNFDWYHPLYAHRHTPDEVRSWFEEAGLSVEHFSEVESGISVLGKKHLKQ